LRVGRNVVVLALLAGGLGGCAANGVSRAHGEHGGLQTASARTAGGIRSAAASSRASACLDAARSPQPRRGEVALCTQALERERLSPDLQVATLVNRGIVRMKTQAMGAAMADFDAAIALKPDTAEAWINKGIAHIRSGDDATAAIMLSHGLELGPENPAVAHYSRAYAYEGLGRLREAYEDYGRAAALAPEWPEPGQQLRRFKVVRVRTAGA